MDRQVAGYVQSNCRAARASARDAATFLDEIALAVLDVTGDDEVARNVKGCAAKLTADLESIRKELGDLINEMG